MHDTQDPQVPASAPVVRNKTVDAVVAAILFGLGLVVVVQARRLGNGWTSDGPGAGYFPFYIGLILCISSLAVLAQSTLGKARDEAVFVDREQLGRVISVLWPAAVFVLGIVFVGMYVAASLYIALFMLILGRYSALRSALVGVAVSAAFFLMFEVWFKVPLYKGTLDPLGFLGY